ncbi:hypothetical protein WJX84_011547 [Apatococcus fuscideae]|uniref:Uncharacterized protein n=1 Tax=Apatococcus fuscideae TaxID=2026836 RepID=A0AAW1T3N1_9CHLO
MPPKKVSKAVTKQAAKSPPDGASLERELEQEHRTRATLLFKAEEARAEEQRWRQRVQAVQAVAQQQQLDALDVTAHLHKVQKDVTAQHLQKVQELEACKRDLQSGLIEKDEQIQALQSRLQEQTEAAKKTSLEYELKIGAMNRPTCFCGIPRPEALQNLFGTYAIHL